MENKKRDRLFRTINKIVEHDRISKHFWNNTGHLCHTCNNLIGVYRLTILEMKDDALIEEGYDPLQATEINNNLQSYFDELQRRLSD